MKIIVKSVTEYKTAAGVQRCRMVVDGDMPEDTDSKEYLANLQQKVGQIFDIAVDSLTSSTLGVMSDDISDKEKTIHELRKELAGLRHENGVLRSTRGWGPRRST